MLTHQERHVRDHVEWIDDGKAQDPARCGRHPSPWRTRDPRAFDAVAIGGVSIAIMLVFVGAPVVGLAVGGATSLGWLLWRVRSSSDLPSGRWNGMASGSRRGIVSPSDAER